jgi:hypothetical protein
MNLLKLICGRNSNFLHMAVMSVNAITAEYSYSVNTPLCMKYVTYSTIEISFALWRIEDLGSEIHINSIWSIRLGL